MPHEIKVTGNRTEILDWLEVNVGKCSFQTTTFFYSAKGIGWELLPLGGNFSIFAEPTNWVIRVWDRDKAFLTRLRWG